MPKSLRAACPSPWLAPLAADRATRVRSAPRRASHPPLRLTISAAFHRPRYVYRAWRGDEQLFNLTADPTEATDLAPYAQHAATLETWRQRMVEQFEKEGRGPKWVEGGKLVVRTEGQTYSPNYPGGAPSLAEGEMAFA